MAGYRIPRSSPGGSRSRHRRSGPNPYRRRWHPEEAGPILTGEVKRVFRQGRQISVELYIPDKHCTHIYEAKRIYYKGAANK